MKDNDKLARLLLRSGWIELSGRKHRKFESPDGKHIFVMARSPSCWHALANNLSILRKMGYDYALD